MQAVVGDPVIAHEVAHALSRPVQERIDLEQAMLRINRGKAHHCPVRGLLGAHPCHPSGRAFEGAPERFDLAQPATSLPRLDRGTETVDAVLGNPCLDAAALGEERLDASSIVPLGLRPDLMGLREQAAGVEGHHLDREVLGKDGMSDRLVLETEAGGEDHTARDGGAGGGEPFAEVERPIGVRKPRSGGSQRRQIERGRVRYVVHEAGNALGLMPSVEYSSVEIQ